MSKSHKDSPKAEIEQTKILTFASLSQSYEANIKIILDDRYPILRRIHALKGAEFAIHCAPADNIFPIDHVKTEAFPGIVDYFKALVTIAKEPMSEKNVFTVLKHVRTILNVSDSDLICDLDCHSEDMWNADLAPFFAKICSNTIKDFIKFRNKSDIVRECMSIFHKIFHGDDYLKERRKCGDIAVASGLIPTLTNMMTSHPMYGTLEDTASSEKLCECALIILQQLLALKWSQPPVWILVETAHPVFQCLLNSESERILDSGSGVILEFLLRTGKKTIDLKFNNGKTGVQYVLLVIEHHLNFMKIGHDKMMTYDILEMIAQLAKLIIHREDLKALSKIMLNMLEDYKPENTKLLVIFAELMYTKCEEVLYCLSELAKLTSGRNYMHDVIQEGFCRRYDSFQRRHRTTVDMALLNIFNYGMKMGIEMEKETVMKMDRDSGMEREYSYYKLHEEIFEAVRARIFSSSVLIVEGEI